MKKRIACFICKKRAWQNQYEKLAKCKNCGFIRAKDKYFKIKPAKLYNLNYFSGIDYENYRDEKWALIANFKDRLKRVRKFKNTGKLLEIGCAFGYFLALSQKYFDTTGVDLDPNVTKIARVSSPKSKILTGEFLKHKFMGESFDIVCMFDVIEHLKNPDKYLAKIRRVLKPNGLIIIETGDIEAVLPSIQKSKWRLIAPPMHLSYFSKNSLRKLLEKQGFKVIQETHVPFYRSLNQIVYRLVRSKRLSKLIKKVNFNFPINTYDLMFIIAQKISSSPKQINF